jgi:hypothetical protein
MQQSKAYVIKNSARNLKATMAARKAEYALYRYGYGNDYQPQLRQQRLTREERKATHGH